MFKPTAALSALALALWLTLPDALPADERIDVKNLPETVAMSIEKRFPGAKLLRAERERNDGRIEYEVEIRHDGNRYEVEVTEDGRITDIDREDD